MAPTPEQTKVPQAQAKAKISSGDFECEGKETI